jgi:sigma-B regulation protein RsbU (phosphoserine phosphatase)
MQPAILEQVRASILDRRAAISQWLSGAPPAARAVALGPLNEAAVQEHLGHLECCAEEAEDGRLGLCTVCRDYVNSSRLVVDYTANVCLDHLSREEAAGLERELEMAQAVQQALLPGEAPDVPGLQMAAFTRPTQIIGGDYFDFVSYQDGQYGWVVGDVAGHGVSASLHMAGLQALCRAVIPTSSGPAEAAERIHRLFVHNSRYPTFVSLFLAAYAPAARTLTYCNAGHNPPLRLRAGTGGDPIAEWLQPTGAAIGLVEEAAFREERLSLERGDVLVIYTDGVVEATSRSGSAFEAQGLLEAASRAGGATAGEVLRAITRALETFSDGQELADDATLVVARAI